MSAPADASVLRARGLRKEYGKGEGLVRAVDGVDLDIGAGETVAVMGPSGCGKSTLLHLLGGLDRPSGGEVSLNGRRIDDLERPTAQGDRIADAQIERLGEGGLDHHAALADPAALRQLGLVDRRGRGVAPHGLHI